MKRTLILVRHGQVHKKYQGICYGSSDVELSELGQSQSLKIVSEMNQYPIDLIYHSDLKRTRFLAELLAERTKTKIIADARLRERHFGAWELKSWDEIYAEAGNQMNGLFDRPDTFAPSGGETTFAFRDRIMSWYRSIPEEGTFAVIAHGGTIAALLGTFRQQSVKQWLDLIPQYGESIIRSEDEEVIN